MTLLNVWTLKERSNSCPSTATRFCIAAMLQQSYHTSVRNQQYRDAGSGPLCSNAGIRRCKAVPPPGRLTSAVLFPYSKSTQLSQQAAVPSVSYTSGHNMSQQQSAADAQSGTAVSSATENLTELASRVLQHGNGIAR